MSLFEMTRFSKRITDICTRMGPSYQRPMVKFQVSSLFNIHSLNDIHGIMSIIYKQVIEVNIEANNA